jgi:two-component system, sensor histidine kinase LadS
MRSVFRRICQSAGVTCLLLAALTAPAGAQTAVQLSDALESISDGLMVHTWVDPQGSATIDTASTVHASKFAPATRLNIQHLAAPQNLWLRLKLHRAADAKYAWMLLLPLPLLDRVTLYQPSPASANEGSSPIIWQRQTAGDTVANADWAERGRYPQFRLDIAPGQTQDIYLLVQHHTPLNLPLELVSEPEYHYRLQLAYLGLGLVFGTMLLLILACAAQSWIYDDRTYTWYAIFASVMLLAVATFTGVAGHLLWPRWPVWTDMAMGCLSILGAASAQLFVWHLCAVGGRFRRFNQAAMWLGVGAMLAALTYPLLPRYPQGYWLVIGSVGLSVGLCLVNAALCWQRGDAVGKWVLIAFAPVGLSTLLALVSVLGWLPVSWLSQYAVVLAIGLEAPLLLVALNLRTRARHGAQAREEALASEDALTGLLAPHLFDDRLAQVVARFNRDKEPAAVVYIDLVNHVRIKAHYGSAVAEQSLLRSVIKLRRLMRDVDTISRVGECRFGLIMEGVRARHTVTQRAAQLIAAGLMPLKGLKPQVPLQFHIAAVILGELTLDTQTIPVELGKLLSGMSPRTRRPIRFLEPENTVLMPLDSQRGQDLSSDFAPVQLPP